MSKMGWLKTAVVTMATLGVCIPQVVWAADAAPKPVVADVALRDGGVLVGQVVNPQGAALEGVPVTLRYQNEAVVTAKTGKDGYFAVKGLRGGTHEIATVSGHGIYRLWAPGTAPPAAKAGVLVVDGDDVVLGQQTGGGGGLRTFLTNPLVIAGVVATAVAVPVAVSANNHHDNSPN